MPSFERLTVVLALVASIMVAVVPPALHFHFGMRYAEGRIEAEAKANARTLSRMVGRNPQMWSFEVLRINELISFDEVDEFKVVLNAEGDVVTGLGQQDLARPIVQIAYPIFDSGVVAGQVVIRKSLYGLAKITFLIFLLSSVVAAGAFIALKLLPLKLLRKAVEHAAFLASHDPLTELPNRSLFNEWLTHSVADVERQRDTLAVLCLDLDHFKEVNDILGHAAGDELLRQATDRMKASLRRSDILARMGGDEFAIIQKHASQPNGASELAERLLTELTKPFDLNGNEVLIGASIGIALHDDPEDTDGQALLRQADLALYRSKHEGRGTFRYFVDEMNDKLLERKRVERELRQAISRNELELHYQPQIDLGANKIKGVEALLRWNHPTQGLISPETFIPLAEECGLIVPMSYAGVWVMA
ncbi:putative bifunctional diguanylate cyclase/phosphodiesterase [Pseudophaeobacter sp. TrK17]|uniref:putative bifunctional diguanylate cyclase/phosphodiesterase n=1 Tax=Pseudophaeobacter sp. TrK17 TaxID=2815167 RepID=UPI0035CF3E03